MRKWSVGSNLVVLFAVLLVGGCGERTPLATDSAVGGVETEEGPGLARLSCSAAVSSRSVVCASPDASLDGELDAARIVGGQGRYLRLAATNVSFDSVAGLFRADVTVENLLGQRMGTADGHTPHPDGIRIFHAAAPKATRGSGTVSVANPDGYDVFTASDQPFFAYPQVLHPGETSSGRRWEWHVPATVEAFSFTVYASAPLQHTDGWVEVVTDEVIGGVGDTASLAAIVRDFSGRWVEQAVTWEVGDSAVARVAPSGTLRLLKEGRTRLVARSGAATPGFLDVGTFRAPTLDSILPLSLSPGDTAILYGRQLEGAHSVRVAGVPAAIVEQEAGQITVALPGADVFPCQPEGPVEVEVHAGTDSLEALHPFSSGFRFDGSDRMYRVLTDEESGCLVLPESGRFLVAATNVSRKASSNLRFDIEGSAAPGSETPALYAGPLPRFARGIGAGAPSLHERRLRMNESLLSRSSGAPSPDRPAQAAAPVVGEVVPLRIPGWPDGDLCSDYTEVLARAVHVGERVVVFEDIANALAGTYDDQIATVAREFDEAQYALLEHHFGDPFRLQGDRTPATGRLTVLISARVNEVDAGFVSAGDLYPRAACEASNEREIVFLAAPTEPGDDLRLQTAARWARNIRGTLVHEVKHVISFANRIASGSGVSEERWLEEASANVATEIWARTHLPYGQGENAAWDAVRCEQDVLRPGCEDAPAALLPHLQKLAQYHAAPGVHSPLGGVSAADASYYGSGWSLLRWTIDHAGVDEADFLRALVGEGVLRGVANLEARAGMEWARIVVEWGLASALDEQPSALLSHPSWDLPGLLRGIAGVEIVAARLPETPFRHDGVSVRGGSSVVFEVEGGSSRALTLRVEGAGDPLVFTVVRVEAPQDG